MTRGGLVAVREKALVWWCAGMWVEESNAAVKKARNLNELALNHDTSETDYWKLIAA